MRGPSRPTPKQAEVLAFIQNFKADKGFAPSHREIKDHFRFRSPNAVTKHLAALRRKCLLDSPTGRARALTSNVNAPHVSLVKIPLLGEIPAGFPGDQQQETEESITIDADVLRISTKVPIFALKVRGDSMIGAAIIDGDTAVIERCEARDHDIVAALIDGEVTLKRYLVHEGLPFLRAENEEYPDLIPARELIIQGVFRALIRPNDRRR